jgi:hypothetical protein
MAKEREKEAREQQPSDTASEQRALVQRQSDPN